MIIIVENTSQSQYQTAHTSQSQYKIFITICTFQNFEDDYTELDHAELLTLNIIALLAMSFLYFYQLQSRAGSGVTGHISGNR